MISQLSVESLSNYCQNKKVHNQYWHIVQLSYVYERYFGPGWLECWGHNCTLCWSWLSCYCQKPDQRNPGQGSPNPGHNAACPISLSPSLAPAPCWLLVALFSSLTMMHGPETGDWWQLYSLIGDVRIFLYSVAVYIRYLLNVSTVSGDVTLTCQM